MLSAIGLPYVTVPTWQVEVPLFGSHTVTIFGPLAVAGVILGHRMVLHHARTRGLDVRDADALTVRVLVGGFLMAHWVAALFYYPARVLAQPWILLEITNGLSSVGGFFGGAVAFLWFTGRRRLNRLAYADAVAFGLLAGFTVGRLGCSLVHDHPGIVTTAAHVLAVGPWPDGTYRYDLGLIELVGLLFVCAFVYLRFDWQTAPPGQLTATLAIIYAVGRFPLDFLRAVDQRYLGLTPAQLACLALLLAGLALLTTVQRTNRGRGRERERERET